MDVSALSHLCRNAVSVETVNVLVPALRDLRDRASLTQEELADMAGVARSTVVRAEQDKPIRVANARKLARALKVTPAVLRGLSSK